MLNSIAHCVKASVADTCNLAVVSVMVDHRVSNNAVLLFEMTLINGKYRFCINVIILKNMLYPIRGELFMRFV